MLLGKSDVLSLGMSLDREYLCKNSYLHEYSKYYTLAILYSLKYIWNVIFEELLRV